MKVSVISLFLLIVFVCNINAISDTVPQTIGTGKQLPTNAVPYFSFKSNVILDGVIDDSIPTKALLDIGAWGIAIPEKFRTRQPAYGDSLPVQENIRFKVGGWQRDMVATYMKDDSQFLRWYGEECVLLGWDFFDNRILEISYKDHYIRELRRSELDSLAGYDRIKFIDRGKRLIVPARVHIDGKNIEGNFWIDTGLNGTLFFTNNIPADYNLDLSKTKSGRAKNLDTNHTPVNILKTDTIQIGNSIVTGRDIIFSDSEWFVFKENDIYIGLIGNQFFRYFSVIFDFRRNNLYLKPTGE
ncbi:hypothetical protein D0T84_16790 [Dysgonomonas sp. 521]|uniref:hypothetical protein n=1 Tax=Dysgonomonas sp. 521 TaxID=2302932 RepID=UPI0013D29DF5|nr:hypothetical protein [Dysgonomonas sp. 521]NDV96559.1 hypothetical protein [Dysgonomonas sp. 521]